MTRADQQEIRRLMRDYVATWTKAVRDAGPDLTVAHARALVQGLFAMVNGVPLGPLSQSGVDAATFLTQATVGMLSAFLPDFDLSSLPPAASPR
jgi:hypothetical protein